MEGKEVWFATTVVRVRHLKKQQPWYNHHHISTLIQKKLYYHPHTVHGIKKHGITKVSCVTVILVLSIYHYSM